MLMNRMLRRVAVLGGVTVGAIALGTTSASAFHCYVPLYTLNVPSSPNWAVFTAEQGAAEEAGYVTECDAARTAGYDALREAGLPVAIKINISRIIGDPQFDGPMNPNGADGHGLEYFGEGSTLANEAVATYIAAASAIPC